MNMTNDSRQTVEQLEDKLFARFGNERAFTVPDGYFDNLTGKVMSRVMQQESLNRGKKRKSRRTAWRWSIAALLAGCVAVGGLILEKQSTLQTAEAEDTQYIEDALDYTMIDNMSIASYLTEAE